MKSLLRLVSPLGLGSEFGFASSITKATVVLRTTLLLCKLRVGATMVGVFMLAFSGMVSAAEDIPGFKGYTWGTGFEVIHQEKDLKLIKTVDGVSNCLGKKDSEFDTQGRPAAGYVYRFYNNKLVAGDIVFFN